MRFDPGRLRGLGVCNQLNELMLLAIQESTPRAGDFPSRELFIGSTLLGPALTRYWTPGGPVTRQIGLGFLLAESVYRIAFGKKRSQTMATAKKKTAPKTKPTAATQAPALTPGTVLKKLDRKGKTRCECSVEADGY